MLQGSMVALVTPMHTDGALDWQALDRLVEFHIREGSDAIVAVGTTGESPTLDTQEHCDVIKRVIDKAAKRIPVIAGTGSNSTAEAIELTRFAHQAGADACLLVTPYYNKPTQEGLFQHYKKIAEAVSIPQILYNVPGRTACDMLPETIARCAVIDNIIGVKEATGDLSRVTTLREHTAPDFLILSGDDATAMESMFLGGQGVISVTANVAPADMRKMCALAISGRHKDAEKINARLAGLHQKLFVEANPIPVKWALFRMGLIESGIRLPLTVLSGNFHNVIESELRHAGIL